MEKVASAESSEAFISQGIDVFLTSDAELKARKILIATGAGLLIPPVPGLDQVGYLTYETIWDLEALPEHLLVVERGPIGCELAQAFRRLGSRASPGLSWNGDGMGVEKLGLAWLMREWNSISMPRWNRWKKLVRMPAGFS